MKYNPRYPAAFLNTLAETGTREELIEYLQRTWDDYMDARARLRQLDRGPNFPLQRIHDTRSGYGRLILPLPFTGGRWLAFFDQPGFRRTDRRPGGFHNCTRTGVF